MGLVLSFMHSADKQKVLQIWSVCSALLHAVQPVSICSMRSCLSRALTLWLSCMDARDLELLGPPEISDAHACSVHAVWWNLIV